MPPRADAAKFKGISWPKQHGITSSSKPQLSHQPMIITLYRGPYPHSRAASICASRLHLMSHRHCAAPMQQYSALCAAKTQSNPAIFLVPGCRSLHITQHGRPADCRALQLSPCKPCCARRAPAVCPKWLFGWPPVTAWKL